MIYYGNFMYILQALITFMIGAGASVFSPFGIGFIVFSIIRQKTDKDNLRKFSFVSQIVLTSLTFLIGMIIVLFLLISTINMSYMGFWEILVVSSAGIGILMVIAIEVAVIIWQSISLKGKVNYGKRR